MSRKVIHLVAVALSRRGASAAGVTSRHHHVIRCGEASQLRFIRASQFHAGAGPVAAALEEPEGRHPLNDAPITEAEHRGALRSCERKSTPGTDGLTYQMLRNLDESDRGFGAVTAYRTVALTSCGCKLLERVALCRMEAITAGEERIAEQLAGFLRHRAATDSIAEVVAALQHARATRKVAALVLLDVKGAFDILQPPTVSLSTEDAGIAGKLRGFVKVFLTGRTAQVQVGNALSAPLPAYVDTPQGSVVSPFLFNMVVAQPSDCLPRGGAHMVYRRNQFEGDRSGGK
ncbi:uncharacterized protein LOC144142992 [Haemaphysalis longicornis]